jgi:hypothetical protein
MMTKDDFLKRLDELKQTSRVMATAYISMFMIILALLWWELHHPTAPWIRTMAFPVFVALVLVQAFFLKWIVRAMLRRHGLLCPECGKPLTKPPVKMQGSTGTCGNCGAVVIKPELRS